MNKHKIYPESVHRGKKNRIRIHKPDNYKLAVDFNKRRLVTENRYELIGIINDIVTTLCFLVGSYFFLTNEMKTGTIMFVIGNANTLFRAILRIIRRFHVEWINEPSLKGYSHEESDSSIK